MSEVGVSSRHYIWRDFSLWLFRPARQAIYVKKGIKQYEYFSLGGKRIQRHDTPQTSSLQHAQKIGHFMVEIFVSVAIVTRFLEPNPVVFGSETVIPASNCGSSRW